VEAFLFGQSSRPLFAAYDSAARSMTPPAGVVICSPFGHEYIRAHRMLRNLALALAASGFHVLRFDYSGCGDSSGDGRDATVEQWQSDVAAAIDELKDMVGLSRVSIVGVRFGATLAAMAAATRRDVEKLVLWDPVVQGAEHLRDLRQLQERWLRGRPIPKRSRPGLATSEIIGFPVPPALEEGFNRADLTAVQSWPAELVVTISTSEENDVQLRTVLEARHPRCMFERIESRCHWKQAGAVHLTLLATDVVTRIADLLTSQTHERKATHV
jgi:pimeloyl-ACP methyl ester carboxylesterase